jgi:hypothetical protein
MGIAVARLRELVTIKSKVQVHQGGGSFATTYSTVLENYPILLYWKRTRLPDFSQPLDTPTPLNALLPDEPKALCGYNALIKAGMILTKADGTSFNIRQALVVWQRKKIHHLELSLQELKDG